MQYNTVVITYDISVIEPCNNIYPPGLPLTSLRNLPLLFVYSQVNNGGLYVLAYVEDNLHQGPLAPLFNPNHLYLY